MGKNQSNIICSYGEKPSLGDDDVMLTDVLVTVVNNKIGNAQMLAFFSINNIKFNGTQVLSIKSSDNDHACYNGSLLVFSDCDKESIHWSGEYVKSEIGYVPGSLCVPIKIRPNNDTALSTKFKILREDIDKIKLFFDNNLSANPNLPNQLLVASITFNNMDIYNFFVLKSNSNQKSTQIDKVKCLICHQSIDKKRMRQHIGKYT